ncbi:MAG: hypothetical protein LBM73_02810 [Candidatus Nomurabacteria bacterium]|jgi:hypothetical protein|nr:hypothetical protein [Candidatus Nomurabacteria bacterium]
MAKAKDNRHRNTRIIAVAALVVAVIGLGVAFAVLSTTLKINGSATIASNDWNIHWANLSCAPSGEAKVVADAPNTYIGAGDGTTDVSSTTTGDTVHVAAQFLSDGDSVTCTMDAVNGSSSLNAKLKEAPTADTSALTDIGGVSGNDVTATLEYSDGTTPAANDKLAKSSSKTWKLVLTYTGKPVSASTTPVDFSYTIPYTQDT